MDISLSDMEEEEEKAADGVTSKDEKAGATSSSGAKRRKNRWGPALGVNDFVKVRGILGQGLPNNGNGTQANIVDLTGPADATPADVVDPTLPAGTSTVAIGDDLAAYMAKLRAGLIERKREREERQRQEEEKRLERRRQEEAERLERRRQEEEERLERQRQKDEEAKAKKEMKRLLQERRRELQAEIGMKKQRLAEEKKGNGDGTAGATVEERNESPSDTVGTNENEGGHNSEDKVDDTEIGVEDDDSDDFSLPAGGYESDQDEKTVDEQEAKGGGNGENGEHVGQNEKSPGAADEKTDAEEEAEVGHTENTDDEDDYKGGDGSGKGKELPKTTPFNDIQPVLTGDRVTLAVEQIKFEMRIAKGRTMLPEDDLKIINALNRLKRLSINGAVHKATSIWTAVQYIHDNHKSHRNQCKDLLTKWKRYSEAPPKDGEAIEPSPGNNTRSRSEAIECPTIDQWEVLGCGSVHGIFSDGNVGVTAPLVGTLPRDNVKVRDQDNQEYRLLSRKSSTPIQIKDEVKKEKKNYKKRKVGTPSESIAQMKECTVIEKATSLAKAAVSLQKMQSYKYPEQQQELPSTDTIVINRDCIVEKPSYAKRGFEKRQTSHFSVLAPNHMDEKQLAEQLSDLVTRLEATDREHLTVCHAAAPFLEAQYGDRITKTEPEATEPGSNANATPTSTPSKRTATTEREAEDEETETESDTAAKGSKNVVATPIFTRRSERAMAAKNSSVTEAGGAKANNTGKKAGKKTINRKRAKKS